MEKEKFNHDIFEMVNNHERQEAIRKKYSEKRKRNNLRILNYAISVGFVAMFFGILGLTGAMNIYMASPIFSFGGLLSAFLTGRWFENGKCLGWR
jgi:hypothetical protein